jgi:hypothetical protein
MEWEIAIGIGSAVLGFGLGWLASSITGTETAETAESLRARIAERDETLASLTAQVRDQGREIAQRRADAQARSAMLSEAGRKGNAVSNARRQAAKAG